VAPVTAVVTAFTTRCYKPCTCGAHGARQTTTEQETTMGLLERVKHYVAGHGPSWSQYGEDVHVRSHFRNKGWTKQAGFQPMKKGFYVDVGCCHPIRLSNTLWFYKAGWRNIDPTPGVKQLFDKWRRRDINLELAVSDRAGTLTFYTEGGRSSVYNTASPEQAKALVQQGLIKNMVEVQVACATLASVLEKHLPAGTAIDFMSVDAEGHDLQVLQSNDWQRFRPEVLLVEAHTDTLQHLMDSELVRYITAQGYEIHSWLRPNLVLKPTQHTVFAP